MKKLRSLLQEKKDYGGQGLYGWTGRAGVNILFPDSNRTILRHSLIGMRRLVPHSKISKTDKKFTLSNIYRFICNI